MNSGKLIGYISQIHKDLYPEYIENSCKLGKKKKKKQLKKPTKDLHRCLTKEKKRKNNMRNKHMKRCSTSLSHQRNAN